MEFIDMNQAVSGIIGPKKRWILAGPINGGGTFGLRISNGVLIAHDARYAPNEPECCYGAVNTIVFADPHGYVEPVRRWWNRRVLSTSSDRQAAKRAR